MNLVGTYNIIYSVSDNAGNDASATRMVNVVNNVPPTIVLNGNDPQTLLLGDTYTELGATATDNLGQNVTVTINSSAVNTNIVGSYNVVYSANDSNGLDASLVRVVDVSDWTVNIPSFEHSMAITPLIKINGEIIDDAKIAYFSNDGTVVGVNNNDKLVSPSGVYAGYYTFGGLVYGNNSNVNEVYNIKVQYQNIVYNILQTETFAINKSTGSVIVPLVLTNTPETIIKNPSLIDYEIPSYYQAESAGSIIFPQPSSYYKAYCVPTSFANVLNYYSDPSGKDLALQLNYTSQNSYPPLTDFLYNYQGRPLSATGVTDLNKIDLGYMFNTNAHGFDLSDGSYTGTKLVDFSKFVDFMNLVSSGAQYRYYNKGFGSNSDISYAYSSVSGESVSTTLYSDGTIDNVFSDIKSDISNGRPVILSFNHWNIVYNSAYSNGGSTIVNGLKTYFYDFSGQVSSTTDIQSTNPLYSDPEYIEEIWDPEGGLGHTVTCVGYIEDMSGKNWVIVQDNVNNSASGASDPNKTPTYVGVPLDASYLAMVTTIDFSPQGTTPVTNLNCLAPEANVNIVDIGGNKYVFNNGSTFDDTLIYGLYNGTYVINNVPSGHPIAFLNNDVSNVLDYTGTVSEGSLQVDGVDYNFYSGTVTLTISGDFGNISAYCKLHGYMGAQNKFTYTTVCNSNPFHTLNSNVSPLPTGYNGSIRLSDNDGNPLSNDFSYTEINNSAIEDPTKQLAVYIENNEIKIRAINALYDGNKLETLLFNLYDELNNIVDASVTPERINIIAPNYEINIAAGYSYFFIKPVDGTAGVNKLSVTLAAQVIGVISQ
uniref:DUF5011 domain-containing protein n=2 Tax=Nucleocytoviricota sp. TaxID=2809609 RepID=A0A9E8GAM2_9VIRU|nr:DUF5011 domain-containing protein [Nucleocytoviricota sp.]